MSEYKDFVDFLHYFKQRPGMYMSWYSIFAFQELYNGYCLAKQIYNIPITQQEQEFDNFLKWVETDYCKPPINRSWAVIMFTVCANDRSALDELFKLFAQYLEDKRYKEQEWYEVWVEQSTQVPSVLLLGPAPEKTGELLIIDPTKDNETIQRMPDYDTASLWLSEADYIRVDGRMPGY